MVLDTADILVGQGSVRPVRIVGLRFVSADIDPSPAPWPSP